jgi:hypothetical protein
MFVFKAATTAATILMVEKLPAPASQGRNRIDDRGECGVRGRRDALRQVPPLAVRVGEDR